MGAPVKPPRQRRTIKRLVSFNVDEYARIEDARGDVPLARWVREAALEKAQRGNEDPPTD